MCVPFPHVNMMWMVLFIIMFVHCYMGQAPLIVKHCRKHLGCVTFYFSKSMRFMLLFFNFTVDIIEAYV